MLIITDWHGENPLTDGDRKTRKVGPTAVTIIRCINYPPRFTVLTVVTILSAIYCNLVFFFRKDGSWRIFLKLNDFYTEPYFFLSRLGM